MVIMTYPFLNNVFEEWFRFAIYASNTVFLAKVGRTA